MIIKKVTTGFVTQDFDTETRRFVGQSVTVGEDSVWEKENGDRLDPTDDVEGALIYGQGGVDEPYLPFEMVQPVTEKFHIGQRVLVTPSSDGSDPQHEFQGVVVGFKNNEHKSEHGSVSYNFVQVRDQEDNVFDCDRDQVHELK